MRISLTRPNEDINEYVYNVPNILFNWNNSGRHFKIFFSKWRLLINVMHSKVRIQETKINEKCDEINQSFL